MPPLSDEDAEALAAFRAGDPEAFQVVFRRYRDPVYAQAYRMLRDQGLALDVVQEAFLILLGKLPNWDGRIPLGGWLAETAWRCAQAQRRRRPRGKPLEQGLEPAAQAAPEKLEPREVERLWDAVEGLSPRDREAVLLRFSQNLSIQDVANSMGITPKAVSSHLARAMGVLRKKIDQEA